MAALAFFGGPREFSHHYCDCDSWVDVLHKLLVLQDGSVMYQDRDSGERESAQLNMEMPCSTEILYRGQHTMEGNVLRLTAEEQCDLTKDKAGQTWEKLDTPQTFVWTVSEDKSTVKKEFHCKFTCK